MADDSDDTYSKPDLRRRLKDEIRASDMGGEGDAHEDGTTERDLPGEVWDRLSQKERKKAIQSKKDGSKGGE